MRRWVHLHPGLTILVVLAAFWVVLTIGFALLD